METVTSYSSEMFSPLTNALLHYILSNHLFTCTHTHWAAIHARRGEESMTSGKVGPVSDQRRKISTISHLCMALTLISLTVKGIATEHEFSILSNSFASQQESSLSNYRSCCNKITKSLNVF